MPDVYYYVLYFSETQKMISQKKLLWCFQFQCQMRYFTCICFLASEKLFWLQKSNKSFSERKSFIIIFIIIIIIIVIIIILRSAGLIQSST